jgi:cytochrome P450
MTVHWINLLPIFRHPYRGYLELHRRHGPTVAVGRPGKRPLWFCADEELAMKLLVDHGEQLTRPPNVIRNIFEVIVGDNIVSSSGQTWRDKRHRGTTRLRDATLADSQIAALQRTLAELHDELEGVRGRGPIDLLPFVERFTLAAAIRLICEVELDRRDPEFERLLDAMRLIMHSTQQIADLRKQMFLYAVVPKARKLVDVRRYRALTDAVRVVADFEPNPEVRELFMAAYENPSTTFTWAMALLASRPEVQARLHEEARSLAVRVPSGEAAYRSFELGDAARLESLTYANAVIRETARLRPAIAYLARQAQTRVELGELTLEARSHVIIVPWCLHMNPQFWPVPERFEPERFVGEHGHRRLWSFGFGPRACPGTRFAVQILAAALTSLVREFRWTPVAGREPAPPSGRFPWSEKIHCWVELERRSD